MIRTLFQATTIPSAISPYDRLHLKLYYPALSTGSQAERLSGIVPADKRHAPMPIVIFFNGINIGCESYHWLAVRLAQANLITVLYTHIAETLPGVIGLTPGIDLARVRPDTYGSGPTCPAIQPILDSLAVLNDDAASPLFQAMDLGHIILGGHSAGGTVALQNGQFFPQVKAIFAYAGHTMAATMLGFAPGTILKIGSKSTLLLRGERDGIVTASRSRYGADQQTEDPVALTFAKAYQPAAGSMAYDVLIQGANHFSIAYPLDETMGRFFVDMEMTRPGAEIRQQIAEIVLAFIKQWVLPAAHAVINKR
ncbi:MAG: hypothetical protein HND44_05325 [Chloroflexi bacterium]|nr:hypothetical protein [Ardenticatenaceae bacterium]MBL1127914.1 hypothetical protein [Chloroflexota bacterium]NOG33984.1 hypothetical protein [Chloroflexota bacterium]GIK55670.1 MAG: hypothetical protein BroJett015_13330 [Chloroflexota bacterium]